jgi:hypothetical protein
MSMLDTGDMAGDRQQCRVTIDRLFQAASVDTEIPNIHDQEVSA